MTHVVGWWVHGNNRAVVILPIFAGKKNWPYRIVGVIGELLTCHCRGLRSSASIAILVQTTST